MKTDVSFALQIENPWRQPLRRHKHAASRWKIRLTVVLDLQVGNLSWVKRTSWLAGKAEVRIVKCRNELNLLIKRVLEVNTSWLSSDGALNRTLGLGR